LTVEDANGDGDPDLTVLSPNTATRWNGAAGVTFEFAGTTPLRQTLDTTNLDFDGYGITDVFALCPANTTASFFKGAVDNNGQWWALPFEPYGVPSVSRLAAGDLHGGGRPDSAGAGEFLL